MLKFLKEQDTLDIVLDEDIEKKELLITENKFKTNNKYEKCLNLYTEYLNSFTDILLQLTISSGFYSVLTITATLCKIFFNDKKLTLNIKILKSDSIIIFIFLY